MITPHRLKAVVTGTCVVLVQSLSPVESFDHTFGASTNSSFSSPALARTPLTRLNRYTPPNSRGRPKSTRAIVSRGCDQAASSQSASLTLLVPNDHDGLTTSSHPTFFWHVSAPVPMVFTLTEAGVAQPLLEQKVQPHMTGIIQLEMPRTLPELVPGQEYRWSVSSICNPSRPSEGAFIHSWIKRMPPNPELTSQLVATTSERERASIYAQAGLWYDALAAISAAHIANPNDSSILEDRLLLLEQAGQTEVAAQERQRLSKQ